jgi:amidase
MVQDWEAKAATKRQAILDSIPQKWRLDNVPSVQEQRDVTGKYVQQFLSAKEVEITETDAVGIAKQTAAGTWSAVEVAEAFCHRASLAHQLVSFAVWHMTALMKISSIVCTRRSSMQLSQMLRNWMHI